MSSSSTTTAAGAFTKVVRLGTVAAGYPVRQVSVFCKIEFTDRGHLSITGVEGPKANGDAHGGCGQIVMSLKAADVTPAGWWTRPAIAKFLDVWDRWHLNHMRAGTPKQEQHLREHPVKAVYPANHYDEARKSLAAAGLDPDNGYRYGSQWLREEVPADVLEWLRALPEADVKPAWV